MTADGHGKLIWFWKAAAVESGAWTNGRSLLVGRGPAFLWGQQDSLELFPQVFAGSTPQNHSYYTGRACYTNRTSSWGVVRALQASIVNRSVQPNHSMSQVCRSLNRIDDTLCAHEWQGLWWVRLIGHEEVTKISKMLFRLKSFKRPKSI